MKANGGKVIAGGYNKAKGLIGAPPANRLLIVTWDSEGQKYADFRSVGVEAVEQK